MVDKIVELENGNSYVILDKKKLDNRIFYYALRLAANDEPTKNYLFFEELKSEEDTYLSPVLDEDLKRFLLTVFTINFLDKVYDL